MKTIEKSMTKQDFDNFVKFNNLEVFSQNQVLAYTASLMPLIQKAQKNELSEEDKKNLEDANFEINNFNTIKVVEEVDGRIIKSLFYVREKQVEELIEKSENGESSKFVFLDTELNRKFGRVGESFEKSCGKIDITKSEEFQTYSTFKKKGISDPKGELKKAHPNVDDAKADEIEKSFEDMISGKKEGKKEGEEKDVELDLESDKEVEKSIELDIIKGKAAVIGEVREWSGKKFKKQANGKWVEVSEKGMSKDEHNRKYDQSMINFGNYGDDKYQKEAGEHARAEKELSDKEFTDEELMGGKTESKEREYDFGKVKLVQGLSGGGKIYSNEKGNIITLESGSGKVRVYSSNSDYEKVNKESREFLNKLKGDGDSFTKEMFDKQDKFLDEKAIKSFNFKNMSEAKSNINKVEKSMDNMLEKITENFEKGLFTEDLYDSAAGQLETLFEKSIMDKAKLRKQMITDKNGHRSSRWVRVNKEEGKEKEPKSEEDKSGKSKSKDNPKQFTEKLSYQQLLKVDYLHPQEYELIKDDEKFKTSHWNFDSVRNLYIRKKNNEIENQRKASPYQIDKEMSQQMKDKNILGQKVFDYKTKFGGNVDNPKQFTEKLSYQQLLKVDYLHPQEYELIKDDEKFKTSHWNFDSVRNLYIRKKNNEIEKSMDNMLNKITENFEKGLFPEDLYDKAAEQLENIFEKSLMDKAKLRKQMITDKNGHRSSRWVRVNKEEGKEKEPKSEEDKSDSKNNTKWTELPVGTEIKFDDEPDRIYKIAKTSSVRKNEDKLKSDEIYITSPGVIGMDISSEYLNEHAKLVNKEDKSPEKKEEIKKDGKIYKLQGNGKWVEVSEDGKTKDEHIGEVNRLASKRGEQIGYAYHSKKASKLSDKEFTREELEKED